LHSILYATSLFSSNVDNTKIQKVQINNQQILEQFKESSSSLAKPETATHTALSQLSISLIENFRFRPKTRSVKACPHWRQLVAVSGNYSRQCGQAFTSFTPNILRHSCTISMKQS